MNGKVPALPLVTVPSVGEWIKGMSSSDQILLILASVSASIIIIIGLIEQIFVSKYISSEAVRHYASWLVFILPITAIVSIVGMFFPRSAMFTNILGVCYCMICLTVIIRLMDHLFGSRIDIVQYMNQTGLKIDPNCAPFFPCLCHCLPKISPTVWRIHLLEWLVYQTSFVRIFTGVALMIGFLENMHGVNTASNAVNGINTVSVLLSIYGSEMLKKVGDAYLKRQKFASLYVFINITQTIFTLEKVITDVLMKYHVFDVGVIGTVEARSQYMASFAYCMEALVLSFVSLFIFNPKTNGLFDKYNTRTPQRHLERNEMELLNSH